MKKEKQGIGSKIEMLAKGLPPRPNPPQMALIACIGLTATTLGLLVYVASTYNSLNIDRGEFIEQSQPIK